MKVRIVVAIILAGALALVPGFAKEKQADKDLLKAPEAIKQPPAVCKFSRIAMTPGAVDDTEIIIGSGKEVVFRATAFDESGKEVPANLTWYFRNIVYDQRYTEMGGHTLVASGNEAAFTAKGLAAGVMKVAAVDEGCVDKDNHPIRGAAEVKVYPAPGQEALCGPVQVKFGQESEITNEKVIGFTSFYLRAEVYGPKKLKGYRVRFYVGKESEPKHKVSPTEELNYDKKAMPPIAAEGRPAFYWAYSPVWVSHGNFAASYELLKNGKPVCASTETYWTSR